MSGLMLEVLKPYAAERIGPFLEEVIAAGGANIHSIHIVGSSVTDDFDPKGSDINSLFVLREMDMKFLEMLAPKGRKYGKKKIAAPFIMTSDYIKTSSDVFPVEFLSFKLVHQTVFGEDILKDITVNAENLRQQCERELKSKLIGLRQGYLSSAAVREALTDVLVRNITGSIPAFRGVIFLFGKTPPVLRADVLVTLSALTGIGPAIFEKILTVKKEHVKPSLEELNLLFKEYYAAIERLSKVVDEIKV